MLKLFFNPKWIDAMNKELDALESNNTRVLVSLPQGKKTIGCKWAYKIKYHVNGDIDRYKSRLVAKGILKFLALIFMTPLHLLLRVLQSRLLYPWLRPRIGQFFSWTLTMLSSMGIPLKKFIWTYH